MLLDPTYREIKSVAARCVVRYLALMTDNRKGNAA